MNEYEKVCQIALTLLKGVGYTNAKNLVNCLGSASNLFSCTKQDLLSLPGVQSKSLVYSLIDQFSTVLKTAEKEYQLCQQQGITPIFYTDNAFPTQLNECTDAPLLLFQKGNISLNQGTFVSIVGTRQATNYGKEQCFKLVNDLAKQIPNLVIVSGLAYGIDIAAHKAALQCNVPTIGVMASGFNRIYPTAHRQIANDMLQDGGILTEQLYYDEPLKPYFIKRNRIIAGLCEALVVVESAAKGGALVTASIAGTYNKDVFVFPGRCNDSVSAGCNALIKHNKASLIENAADLLYMMGWEKGKIPKSLAIESTLPPFFNQLSTEEQRIVSCIFNEKMIHIDDLSNKVNMGVSDLLPLLLMLEFQNVVICLPGNRYKLK
jgi:DNA processing protein